MLPMDEMAQQEQETATTTTTTTTTAAAEVPTNNTGAVMDNGGGGGDSSPTKRAPPLVLGTAERTNKTGLSLTLTPSTSVDFSSNTSKEHGGVTSNGVVGGTGNQQQQPSSTSTVASDQVFVDPRTLAKKGPALSQREEECTREFLEIVNTARLSKGTSPLSWNAAVKFLMARKFVVRRALELYNQHHVSRHQEGLFDFNPETEPLKSELLSGKFTVLPSRDLAGAAIAVFTAKLHQPSSVPHETTLKGVVYQLDAALEDPQTQRCGLVFIYDMSDSKYSNFDYDLSIKILSLLKGGYPARLRKVLIVTAPLWFRAPFRILRLFVREKLRDRVFTVSVPQLGVHIPNYALPKSLGGQVELNHSNWLSHCHQVLNSSDLWGSFSEDTVPLHQFLEEKEDSREEGADKDQDADSVSNGGHRKMRHNGTSTSQSTPSPTPNSSASSGFSDDDSLPFEERTGLTLFEFVEHLKQKGRRGLLDEYAEIVSKNPEGSFNTSRLRGNVSKNRYSDVLCFDHTRVVLSSVEGEPDGTDYINANYVDGYKQKNAFISTQGPLPRTFGDFWKMVWEQTVVTIVMTTRVVERGRTKCGQYWPPDAGASVSHEGFKIENVEVDTRPDFAITRLKLINTKTNESREITHLQFLSWPDYGVPSSAAATLKFLQVMREEQASRVVLLGAKWDGHQLGPPIVVHCSAGIGRTGTLCTMDICMKRLNDQGTIDVMGTVERIRSQRAYSIQVPEQYLFCHAAMVEYALTHNLLTEKDVDGLPDLLAEARAIALEREREAEQMRLQREVIPSPGPSTQDPINNKPRLSDCLDIQDPRSMIFTRPEECGSLKSSSRLETSHPEDLQLRPGTLNRRTSGSQQTHTQANVNVTGRPGRLQMLEESVETTQTPPSSNNAPPPSSSTPPRNTTLMAKDKCPVNKKKS